MFSKLKGKFRLGSYFLKHANQAEQKIANIFRQYFCLALLKPQHVYAEVMRLEEELKRAVVGVGKQDAHRCNMFHNYFVEFWCRHIGPQCFSIFGAEHTTNNRLERFNQDMTLCLRKHAQFFNFMDNLLVHIIEAGRTRMAQVDNATFAPVASMGLAQIALQENTVAVRADYAAGRITAAALLRAAVAHFDTKEVRDDLNAVERFRAPPEEPDEPDEPEEDALPEPEVIMVVGGELRLFSRSAKLIFSLL